MTRPIPSGAASTVPTLTARHRWPPTRPHRQRPILLTPSRARPYLSASACAFLCPTAALRPKPWRPRTAPDPPPPPPTNRYLRLASPGPAIAHYQALASQHRPYPRQSSTIPHQPFTDYAHATLPKQDKPGQRPHVPFRPCIRPGRHLHRSTTGTPHANPLPSDILPKALPTRCPSCPLIAIALRSVSAHRRGLALPSQTNGQHPYAAPVMCNTTSERPPTTALPCWNDPHLDHRLARLRHTAHDTALCLRPLSTLSDPTAIIPCLHPRQSRCVYRTIPLRKTPGPRPPRSQPRPRAHGRASSAASPTATVETPSLVRLGPV